MAAAPADGVPIAGGHRSHYRGCTKKQLKRLFKKYGKKWLLKKLRHDHKVKKQVITIIHGALERGEKGDQGDRGDSGLPGLTKVTGGGGTQDDVVFIWLYASHPEPALVCPGPHQAPGNRQVA